MSASWIHTNSRHCFQLIRLWNRRLGADRAMARVFPGSARRDGVRQTMGLIGNASCTEGSPHFFIVSNHEFVVPLSTSQQMCHLIRWLTLATNCTWHVIIPSMHRTSRPSRTPRLKCHVHASPQRAATYQFDLPVKKKNRHGRSHLCNI